MDYRDIAQLALSQSQTYQEKLAALSPSEKALLTKALIGAGIGGGAGLARTALSDDEDKSYLTNALGGAAIGGLGGAAVHGIQSRWGGQQEKPTAKPTSPAVEAPKPSAEVGSSKPTPPKGGDQPTASPAVDASKPQSEPQAPAETESPAKPETPAPSESSAPAPTSSNNYTLTGGIVGGGIGGVAGSRAASSQYGNLRRKMDRFLPGTSADYIPGVGSASKVLSERNTTTPLEQATAKRISDMVSGGRIPAELALKPDMLDQYTASGLQRREDLLARLRAIDIDNWTGGFDRERALANSADLKDTLKHLDELATYPGPLRHNIRHLDAELLKKRPYLQYDYAPPDVYADRPVGARAPVWNLNADERKALQAMVDRPYNTGRQVRASRWGGGLLGGLGGALAGGAIGSRVGDMIGDSTFQDFMDANPLRQR